MAQPTPQEVRTQWERGLLGQPPFESVNVSAPALAKWAYEKGTIDVQRDCTLHREDADRRVSTANAQRDEAFAKADAARKERDEMTKELAFVKWERDMAQGAVNRQLGAIIDRNADIETLKSRVNADERELLQKADTIRTLNAQLVAEQNRVRSLKEDLKFEQENKAAREQQTRDGYWTAWKTVWDTLADITKNFSGYRGTGLEMAVKAIKDLKAQKDAAEAKLKACDEEATAECKLLDAIIQDLKATITVMQNLETDEVRRLKERNEWQGRELARQAQRICDLQKRGISLAGTIIDLQERNAWQAAELNRMARKFVGRPWFDGITTGV